MGMTREEAIEVLHELDGTIYETQQVALNMAIKALEQEPTTKNNLGAIGADCIDRAELLKAMDTWDKFGLDSHGYMRRIAKDKNINLVPYVKYDDIVNCVKSMPQ